MPMNATPVFVQSPLVGSATLTSPTPITSRANITGTTGLVALTPTSTNGKRIDWIRVVGKGTTTAGYVTVWLYDGTTSKVIDEIAVSAATVSATVTPAKTDQSYTGNGFNLQPSYQLYVSSTVAQDLNVYAFGGDY